MDPNGKETSASINSNSIASGTKTIQNEQPVFEVEQVQLQFELEHSLHRLLVRSNIMYLILETSVFKIDLTNPSEIKQYKVPVGNERITRSWLHSNGLHLIVQVNNANYYYLHNSYNNFKILSRYKNLDIRFIAFPIVSNDDTTGDFLVGTNDSIYLGLIKPHDPVNQGNKRDDKYIKSVYKQSQLITGLAFSDNNLRINLFIGDNLLVWDCFDHSYSELTKVFKTAPKIISLPNVKTKTIFETNGEQYVYLFSSTKDIQSNDIEIQLSQSERLNFSEPISNHLIISDHHVISLSSYHARLLIVNKLSNNEIKLDIKEYLQPGEKIIGITADYATKTYWLYSNNNIYELVITNESISVWYNYYKMGKYEEALKCLDDQHSRFKKDIILIKQGYDYLQKGGFGIDYTNEEINQDLINLQIKGVKILAQSSEPFEKICLMLLNLQQSTDSKSKANIISKKLLIEYLLVKFQIAKDIERNKIRVVILSSWIIELMLQNIYKLENELNNKLLDKSKEILNRKTTILNDFNDQFKNFLNSNYKLFDRKTIYQIMMDLHFPSKLIYYAELIEDYDFILNYYINLENWSNALKTLTKIYTTSSSKEIIYKKSTVLLVNSTKSTVDAWLKFNELDYERLLPAVLTYNKINDQISIFDNHSVHFLSKVIYDKNIKNKFINNYYLSLLITYPSKDDQSKKQTTKQIIKLLNHMKLEPNKKNQLYDPNFILRLCLRYKQYQPAIIILINDMTLFEEALKLALDNELTKLGEFVVMKYDEFISGERSEENDLNDKDDNIKLIGKIKLEDDSFSSKKKLWLMFSKYLIDGVCRGKEFDIFGDFDKDEKDVTEKNGSESKESNNISTNDITTDLINSMSPKEDLSVIDKISSKQLNKVLKYLLNLSNSNNLTLKDLLPLFPESVNINKFKDEIVNSLNQYNNKINQLSMEMNESLQISRKLKSEIRLNNTNEKKGKLLTIIEPGESCKICNKLLINKNFICFPNCQHNFHKDCLIKYYLKINYKFKKIFENFKRSPSSLNKEELDEILLKDCILCNEININLIDNNLIDMNTEINEIKEWEL